MNKDNCPKFKNYDVMVISDKSVWDKKEKMKYMMT